MEDKLDKGRILIVDDYDQNRDFLARRLAKKGYITEEAESGPAALELVHKSHFDLILLDIMMPGMDGTEVLKTLRREFAVLDLPVIMLTAKDEAVDIIQCLRDGANDYVTKPVDFNVLLARIESHLTLRNSALALDQGPVPADDFQRVDELYQSLFPLSMPRVEGAEFAYARIPCWKLAGDFLNIFMLDDLHVGVYLVDVEGHSQEASLLAATLGHLLSPVETEQSIFWSRPLGGRIANTLTPGKAVATLQNRLPVEPGRNLRFSLHYGVLDLADWSYTYVCVGQPTPVLLRHNKETRMLPSDLGALGDIQGEVLFHEHRIVSMEPGDQLYLFSDGIDCLKDHEGLSEKPDALVSKLSSNKDVSIKRRLADLVYQIGESDTGSRSDDITAIGIHRTA